LSYLDASAWKNRTGKGSDYILIELFAKGDAVKALRVGADDLCDGTLKKNKNAQSAPDANRMKASCHAD
jgi:hypothetical protein